jgi:glyoxylase-like metal-dependent hydrolase (beta-lactamase superfamily II)
MRDDPVIQYFEGESVEPLPGMRVLRLGGHFPGSAVLHWPDAADGAGALFTGDTIHCVADPRWVSFMYSYPNDIPLGPSATRKVVAGVEPLTFARLYDGWDDISDDARGAVLRSAERYLRHIAE